jgi:hypothetical protein
LFKLFVLFLSNNLEFFESVLLDLGEKGLVSLEEVIKTLLSCFLTLRYTFLFRKWLGLYEFGLIERGSFVRYPGGNLLGVLIDFRSERVFRLLLVALLVHSLSVLIEPPMHIGNGAFYR